VRAALAVIPTPRPGEEAVLYSAGINLIRRMPQGFTIWGAYTQSTDFELEDINVRRLLILLRRLALREGQNYVFAPHSPAFRRRVKQQFEQVLARLFAQGAFAGNGPSEAYRVVIDETLNTQASIEQGRLIVELRVAPSQPLTFITVRLVQTESGLLAVQEVTSNGG
jgi:phage tail sheath protein FI